MEGSDTVFISKGGCTHFGISVELHLSDDHLLADSAYWIQKAYALAKEYKMDHYADMISQSKLKGAEQSQTSVWYEVEDTESDDNLTYDGISIRSINSRKTISLSQYFN
jgi:hypothetical protein